MPITLSLVICTVFANSQDREDPAKLVRRVKPAVVTVLAYESKESPLPSSLGTGFFLSNDRLITNWHVVQGAKKLEFRDSTGAIHAVIGISGKDLKNDLGILVPAKSFAPSVVLEVAQGQQELGNRVYVLGSPLGLEYTLSEGLVSSIRVYEGRDVVQISAPISSGSSGSPVFDKNGKVIGVATFILTDGQSLNFAIPIAKVSAIKLEKVEPIETATKEKLASRSDSKDVRQIRERIYQELAGRYLKEMSVQNSTHPSLRFGLRDGSVGHIDGALRVFQITSEDSALVQMPNTRKSDLSLFNLNGVSMNNQRDDGVMFLGTSTVLAQLTTYQYEAVSGATRTVFAVRALDGEEFRAALKPLLAKTFEEINVRTADKVKLLAERQSLANELKQAKLMGSKIERSKELSRKIRTYSSAINSRPEFKRKVEQMQEELESLNVNQESIASYDARIKSLGEKIAKNNAEAQEVESVLSNLLRAVPDILK